MSTEAASGQRAAKRKTHNKSRNGCLQCKQRHSKCNEVHPRCASCIRLDIHCTWPARERFSANYPTPPESSSMQVDNASPSSPDTSVDVDTFSTVNNIADMRLLHHLTSKTYKHMYPDHRRQTIWQNDYLELAFSHPFLLRGFLALAAVHMVSTEPKADKSLLLRADTHITKALEVYRRNLGEPKEETAIPMFAMSSVLVAYNLTSADLVAPEDPINAMHHCFRLVQGVRVVMRPNWTTVTSSKLFQEMINQEAPEPDGDEKIPEILRLKELTETKKTPAESSYIGAIDSLQTTFLRVRNSKEEDRITIPFAWTSHISEEFMHLVSIHDPIAVIIFAHFAVLLAECPAAWTFRGWPQRLVLAAQKVLMSTPELLHYLDWPIQVIKAQT